LSKFISGCLVLAFGVTLIYHFALFWFQGPVIIEEPNRVFLSLETIMSFFIVLFGVGLLVRT